MSQRVIACQVVGEYVTGDGVVIGAVGAHDGVLIELDFTADSSGLWEGTTKTVTFTDALGANPVNVLLTANLLADGQTNVYQVPVPQAAMAVAGMMGITVTGVIVSGEKETVRVATELSRFRVLANHIQTWSGEIDVPASAAEQLQSEIDEVKEFVQYPTDERLSDYFAEHPEIKVVNGSVTRPKLAQDVTDELDGLAAEDSLLNARIDGIIAPTGEAPSAEEVLDARTGADGGNYASLGAAVRGQVTDLKSAIANERDGIAPLPADAIIQGSFNRYGDVTVNPARIRNSGFIQVFKGQKIHFVPGETTTQFLYGTFTVEKVYIADSTWVSEAIDIDINADGYIIAVFANATKTDIEPTDYDAEFSILTKWCAADIELAKSIASIDSEINTLDNGTFNTDLMGFAVGTVSTTGVFSDTTKYRIATPDIYDVNIDLYVKPLTGYRIYIIYYDSGTTITNRIGWVQVPVVFKAGMRIKMIIARVTEDTTEIVTVPQLLEGVQIAPFSKYSNDEKQNAVYSGDYSKLLKITGGVPVGSYSVGDVVDLTPLDNYNPETGTGFHCTVLMDNVMAGETITVNSTDSSTMRPWAFLDKDNKLISAADSATCNNVTLVVPNNAQSLLIQVGAIHYSNVKIIRNLNAYNFETKIDEETEKNNNRWYKAVGTLGVYDGDYKNYLTLTAPVLLGNYQLNDTVDISPLKETGSHYTCLIGGIVSGETFSVNATDGNTARPWAFLDKDNKLLSMANSAYANKAVLIAPQNAEYLLIQVGSVDASAYANAYIRRSLNIVDIDTELDHVLSGNYKSALKLTEPVLLGNYQVGNVVDITPLYTSGNAHYTLLIKNVVPNEEFYLNGTDGDTSRPWAFLDKDHKLLSMADSAYANNITLKAPANSVYLIVQIGAVHYATAKVIRYNSFTDYDKNSGINALNQYTDIINKLENASNSAKADTSTAVKSRANLLNLIHFSDIHGDTTNITRLLEFYGLYGNYIHDVIHTGDSVAVHYGDANPFASVGGNDVLNVIGNHECWIQGDTWPSPYNATAQQAYEKFIAPYIENWGVTSPGTNCCYYYKDYSTAKTRVIVLDCIHYDSAQETWFAGALADAITNELRVIAVTHYPAQTGITGFECTFNSITYTIGAVATPAAGTQIERMPESAFTTVDTFVHNGGEFVCWLSGHTHDDFIGVVNNHTNQIQVIIGTGGTSNRYSDCARTKNTKTEDLFNVFTVDGNAKLIKLIRVGSTMDKFMRKRETLCVNYITKQVVSNT